ncbi:hypothetical protein Pfo_021782 [Paulownia fortunei]|nr:hypothetical protein Pfo_021782 [Paulownia fortunei]
MKGREGKGPPTADLLVCFPSRAHLALLPKPICSPARPSEPSTLHHRHHRHPPHHHQLRKSSNRGGGGATGHASPLLWAKTKPNNADISEPTSPKVTCAGQIKVRPKPRSCKNWQSVMEEIERLHNNRKHKKRPAWIEALGFKKDVLQFLTCLRSIRFRCFGSFPNTAEITSNEEEDEDDGDDDEDVKNYQENRGTNKDDIGDKQATRAMFSKWFMILQENNLSKEFIAAEDSSRRTVIMPYCDEGLVVDDDDDAPCAPPPNALLLMRCRSAPAKSWLEEIEEEEEERNEREEEEGKENENGKEKEEEEERERKTDFRKFSYDIAKETWVVGGIQDKISRSRSLKSLS